ncbi:hypothetical protein T484DRAFT_1828039 [Baffinella frigidus]|nr:hypothetical protein T484DRAFT_1828039 [Cryptophyta sp. CCMP2293]
MAREINLTAASIVEDDASLFAAAPGGVMCGRSGIGGACDAQASPPGVVSFGGRVSISCDAGYVLAGSAPAEVSCLNTGLFATGDVSCLNTGLFATGDVCAPVACGTFSSAAYAANDPRCNASASQTALQCESARCCECLSRVKVCRDVACPECNECTVCTPLATHCPALCATSEFPAGIRPVLLAGDKPSGYVYTFGEKGSTGIRVVLD